jgi:four helix bundle protein
MYNFEKLQAWQKSVKLAMAIYRLQKSLPTSEKYELGSQLRRSATSICLNIAEGSQGRSRQEFRSFLFNARNSLVETIAALKLLEQIYKYNISQELNLGNETGRLLNGLLNFLSKN